MKLGTYAIIIAVILIAAVVGTYFGYNAFTSTGKQLKVVKPGDKVSIYYYGYIIINGTPYIFDTNIKSVADNNQTYLKAVIFKYPSSFQPFNFTVGSSQVIKGLSNGIIGMSLGDKGTIVVPPSEGYPYNPSLVHTINKTGMIQRIQTTTLKQFQNMTGEIPYTGSVCFDKTFGWNVVVLNVNSLNGTVTYENDVLTGYTYYPYGENVYWGYHIIFSNSTAIQYEILTQNNTYLPYGAYVSGISSNSIVLNFNNYLAGRTLYFFVEIISIS